MNYYCNFIIIVLRNNVPKLLSNNQYKISNNGKSEVFKISRFSFLFNTFSCFQHDFMFNSSITRNMHHLICTYECYCIVRNYFFNSSRASLYTTIGGFVLTNDDYLFTNNLFYWEHLSSRQNCSFYTLNFYLMKF